MFIDILPELPPDEGVAFVSFYLDDSQDIAGILKSVDEGLDDLSMFTDLGERTITVDCDVLQGDGGTRTASVTGGFVALSLALYKLVEDGVLPEMPLKTCVAAVSAGIVEDELLLDLCYEEDSNAQVDLNCVMTGEGELVELQGTGEGRPFTLDEQRALVDLCRKGIGEIQDIQKKVLGG